MTVRAIRRLVNQRHLVNEHWQPLGLKSVKAEIESNPDIMLNRETKSMRLQDVIIKYIDELGDQFGRSHKMSLLLISRLPIAAKQIGHLRREDYTAFADGRLSGKYEGLSPITPATLNGDMIGLRSVLKQAKLAWGLTVNLAEFEDAMLGLKTQPQNRCKQTAQ